MAFTESITVQILGDSSGLQQELEQVAERLSGLQQQLSDVAGGTGQLESALQGLSSALGPLQGISNQLGIIHQQIQMITRQPITLDVSPALGALQQLIQAAQIAAQQLAALNMAAAMGGMIGGMSGLSGNQPIRGFATGGLVTGPAGVDRVPARLSAGEFVLNHQAVASIGVRTLNQLNEGRATGLSAPASSVSNVTSVRKESSQSTRAEMTTNNHFGGIEVHVRETTDVPELLRDLRSRDISLRHRRG
ncbi:MAG TPA: hypothetical protein VNQ76_14080 [Planctomicrobium sp.]|nr:hypothetical protein [Planctomicrobium sp.]